MDLDERIRQVDPASALELAAPSDGAAREARRRAARHERRARRRGARHDRRARHYLAPASGAIATLACAAVVAVAVLPGGPAVTPPTAAAAALTRAGRAAQNDPSFKLAADQYLYNEVSTLAGGWYVFGSGGPSQRAYVVQVQTIQTWEAVDGSEREVWTYDGAQQFTTTASAQAWTSAGDPPIAPPTNTTTGQEVEYGGPGVLAPPDDLSRLPTDPVALAALINSNATGLNEITSDPGPVTPAYTFGTAARILATPAFGSSPALRAALYKVMAEVPGIRLLGPATDNSNRRGIEIEGPLGGDGYGQPGGDAGVRDEVIIDPSNGTVLELGQVITDPSLESAQFRKFVGDTSGQQLTWTDYLASGVVDSPSATTDSASAAPVPTPS